MCSHYQAVTALERFERHFRTAFPAGQQSADMWPAYPAAVVVSRLSQPQGVVASWGLTAASAKAFNSKLSAPKLSTSKLSTSKLPNSKLSTFNARSESVGTSPTFRGAWEKGQRCVVPAEAVYEPDWRSGRHVPTRLQRADGEPMGLAGLWDSWTSATGEVRLSFTLLTINADAHPLMKHLHKPQDEKRMVVILQESDYDNWLHGPAAFAIDAARLLQPYPAAQLTAVGEPSRAIQDNPGLF